MVALFIFFFIEQVYFSEDTTGNCDTISFYYLAYPLPFYSR